MATWSQKPRGRIKVKARKRFHRRNDGHYVDIFVLAYQKKHARRLDLKHFHFAAEHANRNRLAERR